MQLLYEHLRIITALFNRKNWENVIFLQINNLKIIFQTIFNKSIIEIDNIGSIK